MEAIKKIEVRELQTPPVVVPSTYKISKIAGVLHDLDGYEVFMIDNDRIGMVTMRDILNVSQLTSEKASALVKYPAKLSPTTSLSVAARIMTDYRLRALPIVDGRKIVGVVTAKRILEVLLEKGFLNFPIKHLITGSLITITENDTVAKARDLMIKKRIDYLPVTSHGKVTGVTTSSQIVFHLIPKEGIGSEAIGIDIQRNLGFQVKALMDKEPLLCRVEEEASDVLRDMLRMGKTYALITVLDMVQGIVTPRDYIKLIAEPEVKPEIPVYIVGLPEDPFEAEMAKSKFLNVVGKLKKVFPQIEEARSVIKISESYKGKERRRYEVNVTIKTPKDLKTYTHEGWELLNVYEELAVRLKRLLTQKRKFISRSLRKGRKKTF